MIEKTIMSGFGGQGIISLGQTWIYCAMKEGKHVTFFPFYGAEKRGGLSRASVIVSDEVIANPLVTNPMTIVVMDDPSLKFYEDVVRTGGNIVMNSSIVKREVKRQDVKVFRIPANEMASKLGNAKVANMIMLGALSRVTGAIELTYAEAILKKYFAPSKHHLIPMNLEAIQEGRKIVDAIRMGVSFFDRDEVRDQIPTLSMN